MKVSALASGSSGNCFYVKEGESAILIDAGISCKQILTRLNELNENANKIKGIFVTHEHSDHIKGVDVLARTLNIPVYATRGTAKSFLCSDKSLVNEIKNDETIKIGKMNVEVFSKSHDAEDPVSMKITNGATLSVITDIGHACKAVCEAVEDSDFLIIESNHDISMLENGPYPYVLKRRILSDKGHLSNLHAGLCVLEHAKPRLRHTILSHLSETNNKPLLALSTFKNLVKERRDLKPKVSLSLREIATPLFLV